MPSTINASTASGGGIISSADSSGVLELQTAGTSALVIETTGNINIPGTGKRITGDFSTSTVANRLMFQSSTTDGVTSVHAIPNGTGTVAQFIGTNNSDPTNASNAQLAALSTEISVRSGRNGTGTYLPLTMYTSGSERLRIDTSGNVGIGKSSLNPWESTTGSGAIQLGNKGASIFGAGTGFTAGAIMWQTNNAYFDAVGWKYATTNPAALYDQSDNTHVFSTAASGTAGNALTWAERMRIDSSGNLLVGTTSDYGFDGTNLICASPTNCIFSNTVATAGSGWILFAGYSNAANVNTIGTLRFRVVDNGNVTNTNNSYGAISDVKLKENIVDATPKLEKLNQVRVVNYNLIGEEQKQIGVVAQEIEQIFPSVVEEFPDRDQEGNDLGTTTKSVKYSVFVPMLIKAIQEQQTIINDLKARIETLEAK